MLPRHLYWVVSGLPRAFDIQPGLRYLNHQTRNEGVGSSNPLVGSAHSLALATGRLLGPNQGQLESGLRSMERHQPVPGNQKPRRSR